MTKVGKRHKSHQTINIPRQAIYRNMSSNIHLDSDSYRNSRTVSLPFGGVCERSRVLELTLEPMGYRLLRETFADGNLPGGYAYGPNSTNFAAKQE